VRPRTLGSRPRRVPSGARRPELFGAWAVCSFGSQAGFRSSTQRGESGSFLRGWIGSGSARRHGTSEEQATSVLVRVRPSGLAGRERPPTLLSGSSGETRSRRWSFEDPSGSCGGTGSTGTGHADPSSLPREGRARGESFGTLRGSGQAVLAAHTLVSRFGGLGGGFWFSAKAHAGRGPLGLVGCTDRRPKGHAQPAQASACGAARVETPLQPALRSLGEQGIEKSAGDVGGT